MKKLESMEDLFLHELKDLLSAERQMTKALPKLAKAAHSPKLKEAFEGHLAETEEHVVRLEQILSGMGVAVRAEKCEAMQGLIKEGDETVKLDGDPAVKDAALIAAAQRVEHYEIASYGCARTYAEQLGKLEFSGMLQQTLDEEKAADEKLTELAMADINARAPS
jgi:ferritin-like metal-binding protein YciE